MVSDHANPDRVVPHACLILRAIAGARLLDFYLGAISYRTDETRSVVWTWLHTVIHQELIYSWIIARLFAKELLGLSHTFVHQHRCMIIFRFFYHF